MSHGAEYPLSVVAEMMGGHVLGQGDAKRLVRFLLTDSRRLLSPSHTLFFALKTPKNDGHRYVGELLKKGVRAFVVEAFPTRLARQYPDALFILVSDSLKALQQLAARHRQQFSGPVTAITGSNGKTVVKEWLFQALSVSSQVARNPKSFNSQVGVPLSVWMMTSQHDMGLFEAGISEPGEMQKLEAILKPGTGLFTNIGPAHDAGFSSRAQKVREKLRLFEGCSQLIYCLDHEEVHREIRSWHRQRPGLKLYAWGTHQDAFARIIRKEKLGDSTLVSLSCHGGMMFLSIPFVDDASVENALHVAVFMKVLGCEDSAIIRSVNALQPVAMRLEMKEGVGGSILINDSYNSDIHSLTIALDFLASQTRHKERTLILSDILQSGLPERQLYADVASLLTEKRIDRLVGIGPAISACADCFTLPASFFPDTESFIDRSDFSGFRDQAVLLKGARSFGFERISSRLQQKDHQTTLDIDLDALAHNLNVFRSMLAPGHKVMGMVKAFSYGMGSVEVARLLQYHRVDCLAVAYADEGKALRQGGVHIPIVVMNPELRSFDTLLDHGLEPEIYGFSLLDRFVAALERRAKQDEGSSGSVRLPYPIHVKLDTGMHRMGFMPGQVGELSDKLAGTRLVRAASVFSHLAASEDAAHDQFTHQQVDLFNRLCEELQSALDYPFLRHMANSAAISRFPDAHFDMVRLGIGLYGLSGDPAVHPLLRDVATFRSVVSQRKEVAEGGTVGYSRAARAAGVMELAIVPVGYADGLDRRLGNGRGSLLVGGRPAPIVGHISMDMCALDVTGMNVREGDEVIVFGGSRPVTVLAAGMGTIPYEVLTSISHRVKRVFYQY